MHLCDEQNQRMKLPTRIIFYFYIIYCTIIEVKSNCFDQLFRRLWSIKDYSILQKVMRLISIFLITALHTPYMPASTTPSKPIPLEQLSKESIAHAMNFLQQRKKEEHRAMLNHYSRPLLRVVPHDIEKQPALINDSLISATELPAPITRLTTQYLFGPDVFTPHALLLAEILQYVPPQIEYPICDNIIYKKETMMSSQTLPFDICTYLEKNNIQLREAYFFMFNINEQRSLSLAFYPEINKMQEKVGKRCCDGDRFETQLYEDSYRHFQLNEGEVAYFHRDKKGLRRQISIWRYPDRSFTTTMTLPIELQFSHRTREQKQPPADEQPADEFFRIYEVKQDPTDSNIITFEYQDSITGQTYRHPVRRVDKRPAVFIDKPAKNDDCYNLQPAKKGHQLGFSVTPKYENWRSKILNDLTIIEYPYNETAEVWFNDGASYKSCRNYYIAPNPNYQIRLLSINHYLIFGDKRRLKILDTAKFKALEIAKNALKNPYTTIRERSEQNDHLRSFKYLTPCPYYIDFCLNRLRK